MPIVSVAPLISEGASPSKSVDVAVVGAGPQALTLVTHLLQKNKNFGDRLVVLDPSGTWMQQWHQQFAAFEIPHLRSPAVHHPDPDPHRLRTFAEGRSRELYPPYDLPGTELFRDFCADVIRRWHLENTVIPAQVNRIQVESTHRKARFRLHCAEGEAIAARRVVLALGGGRPQLPAWVVAISRPYPPDRLCHSSALDLRHLPPLTGERVLIVGSGLTSGHLALGAIARGAKVIMMARRQFYEKLFDAEPGWLGPKYLKGFCAEPDWTARWQMVQAARNGGSLTPALFTRLRRLEREGHLTFYNRCQVQAAQWQGSQWRVWCQTGAAHDCLAHQPIDRIWLATGAQLDVGQWPILESVRAEVPIPLVEGLPVLDEHLRWGKLDLFVMGGAAALQLGPAARNLYGGRMASQRIVPALLKASLQRI